MNRVHMTLDVDTANEGQLTAVSNFFKEMAKAAPGTLDLERDRLSRELEVHNKHSKGRITREDLMTPEAEEALKQLKVVAAEEVPGKPSAPQEESSPKSKDTPGKESKRRTLSSKRTSTKESSIGSKQGSEEPSKKPSTGKVEDLKEPLRVLLAEKVDDHRAVIKKELAKYDAKGISNLSVEYHATFMEFMEGLK